VESVPDPAAVAPGALVLGRYRPIRPLGSGGAGSVWLARDEKSDRNVALKIVPREGMMGPRAEREAAAAAQLRHSRCLRAYALARDSEHVYIAYEYFHGRTLRHAMRAGELNDRDLLEAATQILDGLAHAHGHGIVHRDVKPANVLLAEGPEVSTKIMDFGLALIREEETLTAVGDIPGTLAYISPERLKGQTAGPAADIWSVGVILWEGLAGQHPFWNGTLIDTARRIEAGAPSLATLRPDLPKQLIQLVDRALAVDAKRRPSASSLAAGLSEAATAPRRRPRRQATRPPLRMPSVPGKRLVPAAPAVLFAGWTASALPFYPAGWWAGLAFLAGGLATIEARAGLAFALAVPILPLGNYSLGLAIVYAAFAIGWLALSWRDARTGLFLVLGPLLGPVAALGLLPLAAQGLRTPWRRAAQVGAGVLASGAVAGLHELPALGVAGSAHPPAVAEAIWRAFLGHPSLGLEAAALAGAAILLPFARGRGLWAAAGFGGAMLVLTILPAPSAPALSLVAASWLTAAALAFEPFLRTLPRPTIPHRTAKRQRKYAY
jgi:eukaryotic-like serine/threonine-protein kinase